MQEQSKETTENSWYIFHNLARYKSPYFLGKGKRGSKFLCVLGGRKDTAQGGLLDSGVMQNNRTKTRGTLQSSERKWMDFGIVGFSSPEGQPGLM